jgi:hypothetical protein
MNSHGDCVAGYAIVLLAALIAALVHHGHHLF